MPVERNNDSPGDQVMVRENSAQKLASREALGFESAKQSLAARVRETLSSPVIRNRHATPPVVRIEAPVEKIDVLSWLDSQFDAVKTYWSDRENGTEMAGVGAADVVFGTGALDYHLLLERMRKMLSPDQERLRYYGGARFDTTPRVADEYLWGEFGSHRFVLPRLELWCEGDRSFLACNVVADRPAHEGPLIQRMLDDMVFPVAATSRELPAVVTRSDCPDRTDWSAMMDSALSLIRGGDLAKLVLARKSFFEFTDTFSAASLVQRLSPGAAGCFRFCFQTHNGAAFLGATPELLYQRYGREVHSEAVAGTYPRGEVPETDSVLEREFLNSEKDRLEHVYVQRAIEINLRRLCDGQVHQSPRTILKTSTIQHLNTRYHGTLRSGVNDADILSALHPTPAVGGWPTDRAIARIREIEPFDRGWYAGPVGCIGHQAAVFAVAIRSGLMLDNTLHLFAGAGIVDGSTAEDEWREIDSKLDPFTRLFSA